MFITQKKFTCAVGMRVQVDVKIFTHRDARKVVNCSFPHRTLQTAQL